MPTVTLDRHVVEKLIGKKLSDAQLKDRLAMLGTDVESVTDKHIIVEVFPHRPDMLSEQGFGRALRSFLGVKTGLQSYPVKKSGYKVIVHNSVTMRPYTACALVKKLQFTDECIREVMQVQEKLAMTHGRNRKKSAYGIYPLHAITFPIQYIAKDPAKVMFHALGSEQKVSADQIALLHPLAKRFGYISKGWTLFPFFIDAKDNVMCMLPFTNSHDTGKIDVGTTEIFIECTGTNLVNVHVALAILTAMFADMGGDIYSLDIVYGHKTITTPDFTPRTMELDLTYINKRLGLNVKEKDALTYLKHMGYDIHGKEVSIPAYRADVMHQCDLAEDIAIAYGYDNIQEEIPTVATIAQEDPYEIFKNRIATLFIGLGLTEVLNYHLIDKEVQTTFMNTSVDVLHILDPVSEGYNSLRSWILPGLMQTLQVNRTNEYPQRIFEIGTVFTKDAHAHALADEVVLLALVLSHKNASYTEAMQILDYLMRMLHLEYTVVDHDSGCFLKGRCGSIILKNSFKVAYVGEMDPHVLENFGIDMPVVGFELNLTELFKVVER